MRASPFSSSSVSSSNTCVERYHLIDAIAYFSNDWFSIRLEWYGSFFTVLSDSFRWNYGLLFLICVSFRTISKHIFFFSLCLSLNCWVHFVQLFAISVKWITTYRFSIHRWRSTQFIFHPFLWCLLAHTFFSFRLSFHFAHFAGQHSTHTHSHNTHDMLNHKLIEMLSKSYKSISAQ